jgi:inorganic triphosphatase YgiF|tara:strand:- start:83 stop:721 length:639 start_codon:yes stop_codon:yes gene_type:complete
MDREIEIKLDVPQDVETDTILERLERIVQDRGFMIVSPKVVERDFQYYDTLNLDIYRRGETLRRVGGFDPTKSKGAFRYDFKIGPIDNRYEANHWTNQQLDDTAILKQFDLERFYAEIFPSASAKTQHHKMKLERRGTIIEATLDYFNVHDGAGFRELELELEQGDVSGLTILSDPLQSEIGLERTHKQKYSRVIESILKYKTLIENCPPKL